VDENWINESKNCGEFFGEIKCSGHKELKKLRSFIMSETETSRLVEEIDHVDFREFWWDSDLLKRASQVYDMRIVAALARRHQCLSNKRRFLHISLGTPSRPLTGQISIFFGP